MKSFRDIRVIPVVLVAIFGLAVLKVAGLVIDGGYVFEYQVSQSAQPSPPAPPVKRSWAQDNLSYPSKADLADITGSVKKEEKKEEPKPAAPATEPPKHDGVVVFPDQNPQAVSPSERAILERLQARRQELEQRAREIEICESLPKSAEKRIRQTERRTVVNRNRVSRIRTFVKKVEAAIESGDKAAAAEALKAAQPEMHRGVTKGVLQKNTVARKLSRLSGRIKAL